MPYDILIAEDEEITQKHLKSTPGKGGPQGDVRI